MRKKLLAFALFSSVFLTACSQESSESDAATSSSNEAVESQAAESTTESVVADELAASESAEQEAVEYSYQINPKNSSVEAIDEAESSEEKLALLTFDDAPDKHALEMARKLKKLDAPAIFFVNGMYIEESEEGQQALQEIYDMGFEIGNHTHTHANLQTVSEETQREEILKTSELVEEIIGVKPRFFRAPHGANTDFSEQLVAEEDMLLMNWSFGYDFEPEYQDAEALTDITLNTELLYDGANILMHDRSWTNEAIEPIVEGLREKGFILVDPSLIASPESEEQ